MAFWTKSRLIFNAFRDNARASIRQVARQTGLSKSSVHRLGQAMVRSNQRRESWFWETEDGRRWLIRLVVAVLYVFGLKRGGGRGNDERVFRVSSPRAACGMFAHDAAGVDGTTRSP